MARRPMAAKASKKEKAPIETKATTTKKILAPKAKPVEKAPEPIVEKPVVKRKSNLPLTGKRGRVAGVRYGVPEDVKESIINMFSEYEENTRSIEQPLESFIEKGNRAAIKKARELLMKNYKLAKEFRQLLQDAKASVKVIS